MATEEKAQAKPHAPKRWWFETGIVSLIAMAAALIAALVGFFQASYTEKSTELAARRAELAAEFPLRIRDQVEALSTHVKELEKTITGLTKVPDGSQLSVVVSKLSEDTGHTSARLKTIEEVILDSPDKALSIPLLRKDFDAQRNAFSSETTALRGEIARLYDFNKWFFGLIATMALSSLGFAASNFFKKKEQADEKA